MQQPEVDLKGAAADAILATFAARLDTLVAFWELSIRANRRASVKTDAPKREPADVLAELESELKRLERHCAEHREVAEREAQSAHDWEGRAMLALRDGREDLAQQALVRQGEFVAAAEVARAEVMALEGLCETYDHAIAAIRQTVDRPA